MSVSAVLPVGPLTHARMHALAQGLKLLSVHGHNVALLLCLCLFRMAELASLPAHGGSDVASLLVRVCLCVGGTLGGLKE